MTPQMLILEVRVMQSLKNQILPAEPEFPITGREESDDDED